MERPVHRCLCDACQADIGPEAAYHQRLNLVLSRLDEQQRRWVVALEAGRRGHGGICQVAAITGLSARTIQRGQDELAGNLRSRPTGLEEPAPPGPDPDEAGLSDSPQHSPRVSTQPYRVRRPGGGRKPVEVKYPGITAALERLLADEVAGDPMTEQRWVRSSLRRLSKKLKVEGHQASPGVVRRLLKGLGFSLKANKRKQGRPGCPERDAQFQYIASQRQRFVAAGLPVISVDTKKKELIGPFRRDGRTWRREAEQVDEHDFPGTAECLTVPFGIYDVTRNEGFVYVGVSNNTPAFAVRSITDWWENEGRRTYPQASELLILADGGGGNGSRVRAWKAHIQDRLCDTFGLTVTVCHYPTGCSKRNPVEHRLFSHISVNWAGKPLRSLPIMLGYIRGTTTTTGLSVKAYLDENTYPKGEKRKRGDVDQLALTRHSVCPDRNYTLRPRRASEVTPDDPPGLAPALAPPGRETTSLAAARA